MRSAQQDENRVPAVFIVFSLMALGLGRAAAQSEPAGQVDRHAEPVDEITVIGRRPLRDLRLQVQAARERVYDLFNSLNGDDELNIRCFHSARTGTRMKQRTCRPQYADNATSEAGRYYTRRIQMMCPPLPPPLIVDPSCLEAAMALGSSEAQTYLARIPMMDQRLDARVRELTRENPEFRRAVASYEVAKHRYAVARGKDEIELRVSVSIIHAAGAAIDASSGRRGVSGPIAIDLVAPKVPRNGAVVSSREGWIKLRFSVLPDGTTADVRTVDIMPHGLDALSTIEAVQSWTFEAATESGVRVDWHNNIAIVAFEGEQSIDAAWEQFAEEYIDVAELISSEQYEEARSRNQRMQRAHAVTLNEMAFAQMQLAAIEEALGDSHAALLAMRRATLPSVDQLEDEELRLALEYRFSLERRLGLAVDALETYERRVGLGDLPPDSPIALVGTALSQAFDAPDAHLAQRGKIDANGQWEHSLTWPTFSISDVAGRTDRVALECNLEKGALPYEPAAEMTIPDGWGECSLFVEGEPDTTFTLYEFRNPGPGP